MGIDLRGLGQVRVRSSAAIAVLAIALVSTPACSNKGEGTPGKFPQVQAYTNTNRDLGQPPPEDGQWVMAAKDYSNARYSGLDQINTGNVKNLKLAWTF